MDVCNGREKAPEDFDWGMCSAYGSDGMAAEEGSKDEDKFMGDWSSAIDMIMDQGAALAFCGAATMALSVSLALQG